MNSAQALSGQAAPGYGRRMLNKVPEITLYFWVIKILCTTVGETFADNLNENLGLGLTNTSYIMGAVLIAVMVGQFRSRRYIPGIYWLAVVLVSVVGTLVSDNLVENYGVTLETTTIAFSACLIATFAAWYWSERTLSVHTIVTTRREAFYWAAVLATFALGTAAGDFTANSIGLGYFGSIVLFAAIISIPAIGYFRLGMGSILAFWFAYVVTRPLGASVADWLGKPEGVGLGNGLVSLLFAAAIALCVRHLARTGKDTPADQFGPAPEGAALQASSP